MKLLMLFGSHVGSDDAASFYRRIYRTLEDEGALDDCRVRLAAPVFGARLDRLHATLTRDMVRERPDVVQLIVGGPADLCEAQKLADMFKNTEVRVVVLMGDGATSEHAAAIANAGVPLVVGPTERKHERTLSAVVRLTYMSTWLRGFYTSLGSQSTKPKPPEAGADGDANADLDRVVDAYEAARKAMKELVVDASARVGAGGAMSGTKVIQYGDNAADDCEHRYERFFDRLADVELVDAMRVYTAPIIPVIANEYIDLVRWLLKRHDDPTANDDEIFFAACGTCDCDMVRAVLEDPRINPSARGNKALVDALESNLAMATLLSSDPRVKRSMQARSMQARSS